MQQTCSMIFVGQLGEIYRMSYTFTLIGSIFTIPQILNCFKKDKLNLINPVWNCKVDKVENQGKITLNISLNVED